MPADGLTLSRGRSILVIAALVAAWLLAAAWCYHGLFMDDAYIGFHYVANLLSGKGFVFNPPARVEGVTNTGWLLFLTPFAALLGPLLAAKAAGILLLAVTVALTAAAAPNFRIAVLALLTTACHAELVGFSLLGMETGLLAALVIAIVALAGRGRMGWLPALGTFAFLVHPEAGLVAPLGAFLAWRSGVLSFRSAARTAGACALGLAAATFARWLYFGALLPNTFAAKPAVASVVRQNLFDYLLGSSVNVGVPFAGLFALPFAVLGWHALRRTAPLTASFAAAGCLTGLAFALYARPDWTLLARYFAPYAPCGYLLLWSGTLEAEEAVLAGRRRMRMAGWAGALLAALGGIVSLVLLGWNATVESGSSFVWIGLALLWVLAGESLRALDRKAGIATAVLAAAVATYGAIATIGWTTESKRLTVPGYILTSRTLVEPALWMRDHLPKGATIATRRIGALSYFSDHSVFDYSFGLTEPTVAQLIRARGANFTLPSDPRLATVWRERAPGYILEDGDVIHALLAATGGTAESFDVQGLRYGVVRRFPIGRGVDWVLAGRR